MAKTGYIASIAPRHPISYPYVRTYMPRGAARDVIKWAWSNLQGELEGSGVRGEKVLKKARVVWVRAADTVVCSFSSLRYTFTVYCVE